MNPGIYDNITNADYHGGEGISKSGLDLIAKSPIHFAASKFTSREPTKAQALGTAAHALILEPKLFDAEYAVELNESKYPDALKTKPDFINFCDEFGIVYKKSDTIAKLRELMNESGLPYLAWDDVKSEYEAANAGKTILDAGTLNQLHNMRDAVMAHPKAAKFLSKKGKAEQSVYWNDPETGELCRCRPDYLTDCGWIVDLKTTMDASLKGFSKSIANFRYHVQAPYYMDGLMYAGMQSDQEIPEPKGFVFIAVEKDACVINGVPKGVGVYVLDEESMIYGQLEYQENLKTYHECKENNEWLGYSQNVETIGLPNWAFKREEV